ncbi:hypothetical protein ATE90_2279 [Polaribacter sp. Hel1_33_96]|nr:hypothetical protein PHEL49_2667 [Polaribacter sp. Hel1_33_49]PKV65828.1 hypothetical protein ATE90_2279 [Polaribacter sp. Hel1_33_96]
MKSKIIQIFFTAIAKSYLLGVFFLVSTSFQSFSQGYALYFNKLFK